MGIVDYSRRKSPWILHLDTGGCNGCSIEIMALLTPKYDVERFGVVSKANPRHTDILILDGAVSRKIAPRVKRIYEQTPEPKVVMAVGACAITKGIFHDAYNICGPLDKIIPVDVYVPGCPPKPEAIIDGLIKALELWKSRGKKSNKPSAVKKGKQKPKSMKRRNVTKKKTVRKRKIKK